MKKALDLLILHVFIILILEYLDLKSYTLVISKKLSLKTE